VSSVAEENKALVRRFITACHNGDLDTLDELMTPDFVDRSLMPGQGPTREDFKRSVTELLDAFSTTSFTIEEQIAAEGERVVTKYIESGVQRGEIMGIPPTGKEETAEGVYIHRISGGKIAEEWGIFDSLPVMENLAQEIYVSANASSKTLGWRGASSKPRSPRRCPNWRVGRFLPSTSLPERWEVTSTSSSS
jgi:steroid delta-isomerase-like uncharacterized protein